MSDNVLHIISKFGDLKTWSLKMVTVDADNNAMATEALEISSRSELNAILENIKQFNNAQRELFEQGLVTCILTKKLTF